MKTFRITLDAPFNEVDLFALESYLKDAGYFVDLETIPPTDEEMGGKTVALILITSTSLIFEQVQESVHFWQHSHPHVEVEFVEIRRKEPERTENKPKDEQSLI